MAERLSFTRAAADLHIAQQSLSAQITVLERTLGARLFDRDSTGTRLSEVGRIFLPEACAVLARAEEAVGTVTRAARGEIGRLHVAFLSSVANYMLPPIVRAFRAACPDVELITTDTGIADLVAGLRDGTFDAAFTRPPLVDDLVTRTLIVEPVCAVLPVAHRLAGRDEIQLAELADDPWVLTPRTSWPPWHAKYDRDFAMAGFSPQVAQRAATVPSLLGLVAAGVGVTWLARSARTLRDSGVVFVPLSGEQASTVAAWRPDADRPALPHLLTVATELAATTDLTRSG
ncbi:LysR family transcriptional regulator [Actinoplanes friuliensis DSM 7358]|uniref:LysR family transcriptional regulator n=1 Tax=Actinoplanes friuliensis DSM 7358 TaxID=1246995 RepID=U5W9T9_9ACTN|nr:LysR family transcriptional regulator [Actinoplanes friuliensis DSM 7358]